MSSYNSIEKIKYTDNLSDAVSLDEYIIFGNERAEQKYIVFRFSNNVDQNLIGMKFEVKQYDMHDNLIERSVVIYNNFLAKANSVFVPKAKLRVLYGCKRISIKLLQAAFDRVLWNEGEFIDNSYKFEHYARDEKYIEETERPQQEPPAPKKKKESAEYNASFRFKNITKKNIAVFPKVFFWLTCILLVAAIGVTIWLFPRYAKRFTLAGYDLEIVTDNNVKIVGYEGDEETITVPKSIDDHTVVSIGNGAFRHLKAKSIILPNTIERIETGAFSSMKQLAGITCTAEGLEVQAKAFNGIESLTVFEMTGAKLMKNCFFGCSNLARIIFLKTDVEQFVDLFGETTHAARLKTFEGAFPISETFFNGVTYTA